MSKLDRCLERKISPMNTMKMEEFFNHRDYFILDKILESEK